MYAWPSLKPEDFAVALGVFVTYLDKRKKRRDERQAEQEKQESASD